MNESRDRTRWWHPFTCGMMIACIVMSFSFTFGPVGAAYAADDPPGQGGDPGEPGEPYDPDDYLYDTNVALYEALFLQNVGASTVFFNLNYLPAADDVVDGTTTCNEEFWIEVKTSDSINFADPEANLTVEQLDFVIDNDFQTSVISGIIASSSAEFWVQGFAFSLTESENEHVIFVATQFLEIVDRLLATDQGATESMLIPMVRMWNSDTQQYEDYPVLSASEIETLTEIALLSGQENAACVAGCLWLLAQAMHTCKVQGAACLAAAAACAVAIGGSALICITGLLIGCGAMWWIASKCSAIVAACGLATAQCRGAASAFSITCLVGCGLIILFI